MPSLICCGTGRPPSPDDEPITLVDNSSKLYDSKQPMNAQPTRAVSASSNGTLRLTQISPRPTTSQPAPWPDLPDSAIKPRNKVGSGFVRTHVSERLSRSLSSAIPAAAQGRGHSDGQVTYKEELEGRAISQDAGLMPLRNISHVYDQAAMSSTVPLAVGSKDETNRPSVSEAVGDLTMSTKNNRAAGMRPDSNSAARILSRMLTDRVGHLTGDSCEDTEAHSLGLKEWKRSPAKKYVFSDDMPGSPGLSLADDGSEAKISNERTYQDNHDWSRRANDNAMPPPSPEIQPMRLPSMDINQHAAHWRLSYSAATKPKTHIGLHGQSQATIQDLKLQDHPDIPTVPPPCRPIWMRSISSVLPDLSNASNAQLAYAQSPDSPGGHHFGGIDGRITQPPSRRHSVGSTQSSVHLYNMYISKELASQSQSQAVSPMASVPYLRDRRSSEQSWRIGSDRLSIGSGHRVKGSPGPSEKSKNESSNDNSWGQYIKTSPSLYSPSSSRDEIGSEYHELRHAASISGHVDEDAELGPMTANQATEVGSIGMQGQELARTYCDMAPTHRYFSQQDLDDLTIEIAARPPPRSRSASQFDGSQDSTASRGPMVQHTSSSQRPSQIVGSGVFGTSVWDQALQAHADEDRRLSKLRPGSLASSNSRGNSIRADHRPKTGKSSLSQAYSSSTEYDESVQQQLTSYTLPRRLTKTVSLDQPDILRQRAPTKSSWHKYPSQGRYERANSPASEADHVQSRNFAPAVSEKASTGPPVRHTEEHEGASPKHITLHDMRHRLTGLYHSKSLHASAKAMNGRLWPEARGHRSSTSKGSGTMARYPDLEILGPVLMEPGPTRRRSISLNGAENQPQSMIYDGTTESAKIDENRTACSTNERQNARKHIADPAKRWSEEYEDCLVRIE